MTPSVTLLERMVCIDLEASALGPGSYPIEVGIADPATGDARSWLIQPSRRWLDSGVWSDASAAVHSISRQQLVAEGQHAADVCRELLLVTRGRRLISDHPTADQAWLRILVDAALDTSDETIRNDMGRLEALEAIAWKLAIGLGRHPETAWIDAEMQAFARFPQQHRAVADARRNAEILRHIAGIAGTSAPGSHTCERNPADV